MKTYYVYQVTDPITKEFYIGSRSFSGNIDEDNYTGSPYVWKKSKVLEKIIIKEGFSSLEQAIEYERELIIANIKNPLNRNYSIPHPKWNRDGKVTAKDEKGKIISVFINDPLLKTSLFGVTKGKVVVRDENGNIFMTDKDNPDYLSGKLQHANKGQMTGEFHPNIGKRWINDGQIQKLIKTDIISEYIQNGWFLGTLQKGKKTESSHTGSCWIHNIELQQSKRIKSSDLDGYLSKGWLKNRLKLGKYEKRKQNIPNDGYGTI
jgi:hypothetical protein